ncbi:hypothetical protein GCM10025771_18280 [Niveibacterium umoris]|uniref:Uncharacterized protein n=1 Tax=Niveibacterium umoris TaxID=1193620 RepID=A0A840BK36_9RHOO|nr:hypothetical protein [Niveibacterium umoris]MBB4012983.1 hypothetical protein [Niveibacterium umoris]
MAEGGQTGGEEGRHCTSPIAVQFTYSGIATNDSEYTRTVSGARATDQDQTSAMAAAGYRPNLRKRGSLHAVFDGRNMLTRYSSPIERHRLAIVGDRLARDDVERFDLESAPQETHNLGLDRAKHASVPESMRENSNSRSCARLTSMTGVRCRISKASIGRSIASTLDIKATQHPLGSPAT